LDTGQKILENSKIPEIKISKGTVFQVDNQTLEASLISPPNYDIREIVPIPNSSKFLITIYENEKSRICSADSHFKSIIPITDGHLAEGIAVTADGEFLLFDREVEGNRDIYRMNIDGTNLQRLTTHPSRDFSGSWSPDSTKIAFSRDGNEHIGIYLMNADGSEQKPLLIDENDNLDPSWSPKGDMIAFSKNGKTPCLFRLNDEKWRPVIPFALFCRHPSWLPDGDGIAFTGTLERITGYEIYTVQQDWTVIRKLTSTKLPKSSPNFSYDGSVMYYCESEGLNEGKAEMNNHATK
jgi:Tol biopolymer transport system component